MNANKADHTAALVTALLFRDRADGVGNLAGGYLELREPARAVLLADTVTVHDEDILALRAAIGEE